MYCRSCGTKLEEGVKFCPNCGGENAKDTVEVVKTDNQYQSHNNEMYNNYRNILNQGYNYEMYHDYKRNKDIPIEYKPLGAWAYFGWNLLFALPLVGFIILIVFACGATKNINLRNYARSYFCYLVIALIILIIFLVIAAIGTARIIR